MGILVVGTLAFDSVETPFGKRDNVLGGSASFLSTAASYFSKVMTCGVVGEDFPSAHLDFFRSRQIDLRGVQKLPGKTFRWRGHYGHDLSTAETLETQLNVLEVFKPNLPADYRDAKFIVLGNFDPDLQLNVVNQLHDPRLIACDTMNYWIEHHNQKLRKTLKRVDLLSINEGEARMLAGEYSLIRAAKAIHSMGPKVLVIKRGEYGSLLFTEEGIFAAPAFPLEVVCDPTGAGDTFAGGMMGYLASSNRFDGRSLRHAVVMGGVMASFVVEDFSLDRLRSLHTSDITARIGLFDKLTQFDIKEMRVA